MLSIVNFMLSIVEILAKAFVFMTLWEWFVVPVFGLPLLSIVESLGICLCATAITYSIPDSDVDKLCMTKPIVLDDLMYPIVRILGFVCILVYGTIYNFLL